jgi:hypothetical protein
MDRSGDSPHPLDAWYDCCQYHVGPWLSQWCAHAKPNPPVSFLADQDYAELHKVLVVGKSVAIDDGLLQLTVEEINGTDVVCRVHNTVMLGETKVHLKICAALVIFWIGCNASSSCGPQRHLCIGCNASFPKGLGLRGIGG